MQSHRRELTGFLRREYNITHVEFDGSTGKHNKLRFNYLGRDYSLPISRGSSHARGLFNLKADIKRMLTNDQLKDAGNLPITSEELERKIDDMLNGHDHPYQPTYAPPVDTSQPELVGFTPLPEVEVGSEITTEIQVGRSWPVTVSAYQQHRTRMCVVHFLLPLDAAKTFSDGHASIEQIDPENWRITPGGSQPLVQRGRKQRVSYYTQVEPFAATLAEAVEVDGDILIYLPMENRMPPATSNRAETPTHTAALSPTSNYPANGQDRQEEGQETGELVINAERMREVLHQIRAIENACPYRLKRVEGRVVWQAPTIE